MVRRFRIVAFVALALAPLPLLADGPPPEPPLEEYLERVTATLPAHVVGTLEQIDGTPRQLLATRAYLRAGDNLRTRWSWPAEKIKAHTRSAEYRALIDATAQVR